MEELKQTFQTNQRRYSEKEWLHIFPEAEPYLTSRLEELQTGQKDLRDEIRDNLSKIYKTVKDEFSIWFCEKVLEIWKGERLNWLGREIGKMKWALSPEEHTHKEDKITDDMIQRARNHPFDRLVKFNRAKKAICNFHNDKNPSMSLNPKTNRIKCFACGVNIDTIGYIMETQKISFIEAVKYLNNY